MFINSAVALALRLAASLPGAALVVSVRHVYETTLRHKEVTIQSCQAVRLILACSLAHLCQPLTVQTLIRPHMIAKKH